MIADETRRRRAEIGAALDESRARTLALLDLPEDAQRAQHSPLMSPMVWDLAHIGNYEELWLLRAVDGRAAIDESLDDLYNAFEHPRWERPSLPVLGPLEARSYLSRVRDEALALLDRVALDGTEELVAGGFVYGMVAQHEHQHDETLLATRQLMGEEAPAVPGAVPVDAPTAVERGEVLVGDAIVPMGTSADPWAYDNERPAHDVHVPAHRLDTTLVTVGDFLAFVADGGYDDEGLWSRDGWAWRTREEASAPLFWRAEGQGAWSVLRFGGRTDLDPSEPVQHVSWFEADAFARWSGRRLPTEAEWERAATIGPDGVTKRRWPWGDAYPTPAHANLGQRHDGPAPAGAHPLGVNPAGVHQLAGDLWEWTSTPFAGHPGFRSFPYKEYSEVFFGDEYRVLRGGSWATHPLAVRGTFRNWDLPVRRQIFCGFRTAADA